ncbi:MAG: polysaccharide deacetylase family protein [Dokdonella sp.]
MRNEVTAPTTMAKNRSIRSVALMYHALTHGERVDPDQPEQDPHYTVAEDVFTQHLDMMIARCGRAVSAQEWLNAPVASAVLTFDDGHVSNYEIAFPLLSKRGCSADFFVNPQNVGTPGFASWSQLREMAAGGMSIQSHSYSHRYLSELSDSELREELTRSKAIIEERIGHEVSLLAPPGGRMPEGLGRVARECGYRWVLSSRPGALRSISADAQSAPILSRMAVTAQLDSTTLDAWLAGSRATFVQAQLRYSALAGLKKLLGNRGYERLRASVLGQPHL